MDLVASLPPIAVNILEYVFYTGAASDDIEFNLYGYDRKNHYSGSRDDAGIQNFTDVLADSKVPTNLRGCLLKDGRVLLCSGQLPLIRCGGVRKSLGISKYTTAPFDSEYFIFRETHDREELQASCIYESR